MKNKIAKKITAYGLAVIMMCGIWPGTAIRANASKTDENKNLYISKEQAPGTVLDVLPGHEKEEYFAPELASEYEKLKSYCSSKLKTNPTSVSIDIDGSKMVVKVRDNTSAEVGRVELRVESIYSDVVLDNSLEYGQNYSESGIVKFTWDFSDLDATPTDAERPLIYLDGRYKIVVKSRGTRFSDIEFVIEDGELYFPTNRAQNYEITHLKNAQSYNPDDFDEIPLMYYSTDVNGSYYVGDQMDDICKKADELAKTCDSNEEIVKAVHDYICKNFAYDYEYYYAVYDRAPIDAKDYKYVSAPYYTFQSKTLVCSGFARLNQVMLTHLGIPCIVVEGYGGYIEERNSYFTNHEWNMIYLNGEWYDFDLTWDCSNSYMGTIKDYKDYYKEVLNNDASYGNYGVAPYLFGNGHYSVKDEMFTQLERVEVVNADTPIEIAEGASLDKLKDKIKISIYGNLGFKYENYNLNRYVTFSYDNNYSSYYPYNEVEITDFDSSKIGLQTVKIKVLGKTTTFKVDVQHVLTGWKKMHAPDCQYMGIDVRQCEVCEKIIDIRGIPITDHEYSEYELIKEATCTQKGIYKRVCKTEGCGKEDYLYTNALGHDPGEFTVTVQPTCFRDKVERKYCKVCGSIIETKVTPAKHDFGKWKIKIAATLVDRSVEERECNICGEMETKYGGYKTPVKGDEFIYGDYKYVITLTGAKNEVAFAGFADEEDNSSKVEIPASVILQGKTYRVSSIYNDALSGKSKVKTIKINSRTIKSVGKNAIKGINKKAQIKVSKSKYKAYIKLFKKSTGFKKSMKIKK